MHSNKKIRWGIIGAGNIAGSFAGDLRFTKDSELYAVASNSAKRLEHFRHKYSPRKLFSSYADLLNDNNVDIVYIATPHAMHFGNAISALEAGKHVLCEKPFAINRKQSEKMFEKAQESNRFIMEAMWTRFLPAFVKIKAIIDRGEIGEVKQIAADFGFNCDFDKDSRLYDPALGGGSLLDVGIYPLSLAYIFLGMPKEIQALAHIGQSGVDEQISIIMKHKNNAISNSCSSIIHETPQEANIYGSQGHIHLKKLWWRTTEFKVETERKVENHREAFEGLGYQFEADHCTECIRQGLKTSPIHTKDDTLNIMKLMDSIRLKIGLKYPLLFE